MPKKNFADAFGDTPPVSAGTTLAMPAGSAQIAWEELHYDYTQVDANVRQQVVEDVQTIKQEERGLRQSIITIGGKLDDIKQAVPHGQFLDIVRTEFDMNERTAQNWMNVYRRFTPAQLDLFSDTGAMYLLAAPKVDEGTREKVIKDAEETGQPINRKTAQAAINAAKGQSSDGGGGGGSNGSNYVAAKPESDPPATVDGVATVVSHTQHTTTTYTPGNNYVSAVKPAADKDEAADTHEVTGSDVRSMAEEVDWSEVEDLVTEIKESLADASTPATAYVAILQIAIDQVTEYYYAKTSDIYLYDRARDVLKAMREKLLKTQED